MVVARNRSRAASRKADILLAGNFDGPAVGLEDAGDQVQKGCFPAAAFPCSAACSFPPD